MAKRQTRPAAGKTRAKQRTLAQARRRAPRVRDLRRAAPLRGRTPSTD